VVFLDKTWVHVNGIKSKMWSDGTIKSVQNRTSTSTRYIILQAGTQNGFLSGASTTFVSGMRLENCNDSMMERNLGMEAE
jgi:hypothetical protein